MTHETDEQWWERMQRDIRLSEVERIFSSDEAFEASLEDLDPSEIVPLTPDEADRLMRATLSQVEHEDQPSRPLPLRWAAAGGHNQQAETPPDPVEICLLQLRREGARLLADQRGRLAIAPAPPDQYTHLRIGNDYFPLVRQAALVRVDGVGRAQVEDHVDAQAELGLEPDIELVTKPKG